jgi:hypothetical protein
MFGSIEQSEIEIFSQQCGDSPQLLAFIEAHFTDEAGAHSRALLFEFADESPFSLRQWVESLRNLEAWLDVRRLEMSIEDQLGYVSCACESADAGAGLTHLPGLVDEMLAAYGCERATPRAIFEDQE